MTLELYTYADTDITRSSNSASLSLTDGTYFKVDPSWPGPAPAHLDAQSGQYLDIQERIPLIAQGANTNARDGIVQLGLWARKTQLYKAAHDQGERVWMKYQPTGAGSAVWTRIEDLNAEIGNGRNCTLSVTRSGLFEGDYTVVNCENLFTSAASTVTIQNHQDQLTHVYDYNNNGAANPWTGGTFGSVNKPTYLLDNASNDGAHAITEIGDAVWFGCMDDTFFQMYLNVTRAAVYTATFKWEFWNGAAWTEFTPTADPSNKLTSTGTHLITWGTLPGWAKTTINGVSAYWIRLRCSAFTSGTTSATLTNATTHMGVYQNYLTDHLNYVKVPSTSIKGDAPGIAQIVVQSKVSAAYTLRVAKRSVGTPTTSTNMFAIATGTLTNNSQSWGGVYANHATTDATFTTGALALTLGAHNYGTWRALVRAYAATAATTAELRVLLKHVTSNVVIHTGEAGIPGVADAWTITDCGLVNVWAPEGTAASNLQAYVQYRRSSGTEALRENALLLLPADEFYHTVRVASGNSTSYKLILNGFDQHVYVGSGAQGTLYQILEPFGQQLTLEPGKDNYFWFLGDMSTGANNNTDTMEVTIYYVPRWTSVRGTS